MNRFDDRSPDHGGRREALEKHLAGASANGRKASFLDLAGDLIGKYSGPGDLSSNPKFMKDFGR